MVNLNNLYSGTASFGKDYAVVITIISAVICILLLGGGVALIIRKPQYTIVKQMVMNPSVFYSEVVTNNVKHTMYTNTGKIEGSDSVVELLDDPYTFYTLGETINVYTKVGDSVDARLHTDNSKGVGILLVVVGLLIILFSVINLYFVKKYKGVAAVEGAAGAINLAMGIFGK